jgi:hypothetical protein
MTLVCGARRPCLSHLIVLFAHELAKVRSPAFARLQGTLLAFQMLRKCQTASDSSRDHFPSFFPPAEF